MKNKKFKYIKIKLHGGGSYIQPADKILEAVAGELDSLEFEEKITLSFEPVDMTEERYNELVEFLGH